MAKENLASRQPPAAQKFGTFDLFYKNCSPRRPKLGEVIRGWVELNLERALDVHHMSVAFYAEITYYHHLEDGLRTEQFERQTQQLWRRRPAESEDGEQRAMRLRRGFYVYEFFVATRRDLAGAFVSRGASGAMRSLIYYCEVNVCEQAADGRLIEHIKRRPLFAAAENVAAAGNPTVGRSRTNTEPERTISRRGLVYVRNMLDASGCVAATVSAARTTLKAGRNFGVNVEVLNCFRRLKVDLTLLERAVLLGGASGPPPLSEQRVVEHEIYRVRLGKLRTTDNYRSWQGEPLWLPQPDLAPIHIESYLEQRYKEQKFLYLGYYVRLSVKPRMGKSLDVAIPLVVNRRSRSRTRKFDGDNAANTTDPAATL